jgi:hypothetical protein
MCIMSAEARRGWLQRKQKEIEVSQTKLFARVDNGVQYLVYEMAIATSSDVAMVLPLPVAHVADDAVEFLDFSRAKGVFGELAKLFPIEDFLALSFDLRSMDAPRSKLVVHTVGSFEASYVPTLGDMDRLDKRFRISDEIWNALPQYANAGFAVFKLRSGKHTIHPMAMKFATAEPQSIFFPTVHVHDGELHATARFDHALYLQAPTPPAMKLELGTGKVSVEHTHGAIAADLPVYRLRLHGERPNTDTRVAL